MKRKECSITTNTDTVNRMIADKPSAIRDILNTLGLFDLSDGITYTIKLLTR